MTTFRDFEEMEVWQESRKLVRAIRAICKREKAKRDFAFVDQITRSARSVSANIAEGNDALTTREFIRFLGHAKKSVAEVRSHLHDAIDEGYVSQEEYRKHAEHTRSIGRMLAKLIYYLQSVDQKRRRHVGQAIRP